MRKLLLLLLCLATIAKADTQTNAGRYFTPGGAGKYEFQDNSNGSVHSIALPSGLHTIGKATYDSTHTAHGKLNVSNTVGAAQLDLTTRGTGTWADIYLDSNSTGNPRIFLEKNNSEYGRIYGSNAGELALYNAQNVGIRFELGGTTEALLTPSGLALSDQLSVSNGGTGRVTFPSGEVLLGNGTGGINSVSSLGSGHITDGTLTGSDMSSSFYTTQTVSLSFLNSVSYNPFGATTTLYLSKIGWSVTFHLVGVTGVCADAQTFLSEPIPTDFRPATSISFPIIVYDNSAWQNTVGELSISAADGKIRINRSQSASTFTAAGNCGFISTSGSYIR